MPINFPSLPRNATDRIFMLLDNKTRLQIREVCSMTKEMADFSFFNQKTVVDCFDLENRRPSGIWTCTIMGVKYSADAVLAFFLCDPRDYLIWRICLSSIFSRLNIPRLALIQRKYYVYAALRMDQVKKFLDLLNPLIQKAQFMQLRIWDDNPEAVSLVGKSLEGKYIPKVWLKFIPSESENYDRSPLLKIVQIVKPHKLDYILSQITNDSVELLNALANYFVEISVFLKNNIGDLGTEIISLSKGVLSRKCEQLHISVNTNIVPNVWDRPDHSIPLISHADMEKLIKVFHHLGKKVSFTTYTDIEADYALVGLYHVEITHFGEGNWLSIDHVEANVN